MKYLGRIVLVVFLALAPALAYPFGLKTHIWIGKALLAEVQSSCRVSVQTVPVSINPQVCQSIREHPGAFLAGVLGPDAYPDVITGQVTTHPGIPGDWQTADWLVHLYSRAETGPRLAFAAGYLVHAAGDVFAHTYVNAYSGDIFILGDERAVERRHFVLEKYIDARLPGYSFTTGSLNPPAEWLRDKLIHNSDAERNSAKSGLAMHVAAMNSLYVSVVDLAKQLDQIERDGGRLLADIVVTVAEAQAKVATGEFQLKIARETLNANEQKLKAEQAVFDAAEKAFQDAIKALEDKKNLINQRALEAKLAREAAQTAKDVGTQAIEATKKIQNDIVSAQQHLANTPAKVSKEICENHKNKVCDAVCLGGLNPFCKDVCKEVTKQVCRTVEQVNDVYTGLTNKISGLQTSLNDARARAEKAALDVTTQTAIEASKLQEKAAAEALAAGLEAAKLAAEAEFRLHRAMLDVELKATQEARKKADDAANELAKLRNQLIDAQAIKDAITDLIARSDILSGLAKNWGHGMDLAGKEFILAGTRIADGMLAGKSHFVSSYLDWWKCYGHAYGGIPVQFGQATCAYEDFVGRVEAEANKIVQRTLPPPFGDLYGRFLQIKVDIKNELKQRTSDAVLHIAKLAAPDPVTGDFIDLLARPDHATKQKLNEVFGTSAGAGGKPLLAFQKVSDLVDSDISLEGDNLNPEKFYALKNAVTLSKLALADIRSIKGLIWVLGGDPDLLQDPSSTERKSILFDMVRSIDGNHQWQPYGLPYPSASGADPRPKDPLARRYGYGPRQERPGFILFVEPSLRKEVFLRIFEGPVSGSLAKHLSGYPFPECLRNPFPVSFLPDGSGRAADSGCTDGSVEDVSGSMFEWLRRGINRIRLNPYDPF